MAAPVDTAGHGARTRAGQAGRCRTRRCRTAPPAANPSTVTVTRRFSVLLTEAAVASSGLASCQSSPAGIHRLAEIPMPNSSQRICRRWLVPAPRSAGRAGPGLPAARPGWCRTPPPRLRPAAPGRHVQAREDDARFAAGGSPDGAMFAPDRLEQRDQEACQRHRPDGGALVAALGGQDRNSPMRPTAAAGAAAAEPVVGQRDRRGGRGGDPQWFSAISRNTSPAARPPPTPRRRRPPPGGRAAGLAQVGGQPDGQERQRPEQQAGRPRRRRRAARTRTKAAISDPPPSAAIAAVIARMPAGSRA